MQELNAPVLWFHVDNLSSPHAYVRLNGGETEPPPILVQLCAQLVKNGSIEGVKRPSVDVIYTSCDNLTKNKGMNVGQVSFASPTDIVYVRGVRKNNQLLRTLERAKQTRAIIDMERELDDLIHNFRKKNKGSPAAPVVDDDDDGWGDDEPPAKKLPAPQKMFDGVEKAEFSTTLEEDFM
jgi:hypothetical protein